MLERAADVGRGERVVDDEQRPVAVGGLGQGGQVGDDDGRVGDRLDVEDPRRAAARAAATAARVGRVHLGDLDAQALERAGACMRVVP